MPPKLADPNSARLYAIVARNVRRAVVFRRGPAKKTRLIVWNLDEDTLVPGQWFDGRIYERRCDLSPDGSWLAYFAATYRKPYRTWTAISRSPFFTALALWPKGDAWGGGGLFDGARSFALNHRGGERDAILWEDIPFPSGFAVAGFGSHPGGGEDDPIMTARLTRDGWTVTPTQWDERKHWRDKSKGMSIAFLPPALRTMRLTRGRTNPLTLRVHPHGLHETAGRWYVDTADLVDAAGETVREFGRVDWIDADHNGDILLAREGKLERLAHAKFTRGGAPRVIADLNDMRYERIVSPPWARTWNAKESTAPVKRKK